MFPGEDRHETSTEEEDILMDDEREDEWVVGFGKEVAVDGVLQEDGKGEKGEDSVGLSDVMLDLILS